MHCNELQVPSKSHKLCLEASQPPRVTRVMLPHHPLGFSILVLRLLHIPAKHAGCCWTIDPVDQHLSCLRLTHPAATLPAVLRSAVRGMAVFEDLSMLVLAHRSGDLTALPMPSPTNGAQPAGPGQSAAAAVASPAGAISFAAYGVPAAAAAAAQGGRGGSGLLARPGAAAGLGVAAAAAPSGHHTWRPRFASIKAHKNGIEATTNLVRGGRGCTHHHYCPTAKPHSASLGHR